MFLSQHAQQAYRISEWNCVACTFRAKRPVKRAIRSRGAGVTDRRLIRLFQFSKKPPDFEVRHFRKGGVGFEVNAFTLFSFLRIAPKTLANFLWIFDSISGAFRPDESAGDKCGVDSRPIDRLINDVAEHRGEHDFEAK